VFGPTQAEHVIAQAFFAINPDKPIVVRACHKCEQMKQRCDQFLRDAMLVHADADATPHVRELFPKVERALAKGDRAHYKRNVFPLGHHDGKLRVGVIKAKVDASLKWLVRGLFCYHTNRVLDHLHAQWKILPPEQQDLSALTTELMKEGMPQLIDVGGTFRYAYLVDPGDQLHTQWFFVFYQSVAWHVLTSR
jgi:hypothetical protein